MVYAIELSNIFDFELISFGLEVQAETPRATDNPTSNIFFIIFHK